MKKYPEVQSVLPLMHLVLCLPATVRFRRSPHRPKELQEILGVLQHGKLLSSLPSLHCCVKLWSTEEKQNAYSFILLSKGLTGFVPQCSRTVLWLHCLSTAPGTQHPRRGDTAIPSTLQPSLDIRKAGFRRDGKSKPSAHMGISCVRCACNRGTQISRGSAPQC